MGPTRGMPGPSRKRGNGRAARRDGSVDCLAHRGHGGGESRRARNRPLEPDHQHHDPRRSAGDRPAHQPAAECQRLRSRHPPVGDEHREPHRCLSAARSHRDAPHRGERLCGGEPPTLPRPARGAPRRPAGGRLVGRSRSHGAARARHRGARTHRQPRRNPRRRAQRREPQCASGDHPRA